MIFDDYSHLLESITFFDETPLLLHVKFVGWNENLAKFKDKNNNDFLQDLYYMNNLSVLNEGNCYVLELKISNYSFYCINVIYNTTLRVKYI